MDYSQQNLNPMNPNTLHLCVSQCEAFVSERMIDWRTELAEFRFRIAYLSDQEPNISQCGHLIWEFPKIRGTISGVPIRTIVFWGLSWGPLFWETTISSDAQDFFGIEGSRVATAC